jgi:hypothetical protein
LIHIQAGSLILKVISFSFSNTGGTAVSYCTLSVP